MRPFGKLIRTLAAYGLTAAALLAFSLTANAQSRIGSTGGTSTGTSGSMGSSGFGGSGGSGGSSGLGGGSSGFGNNGNGSFSFAGGSSFVGSSSSSFAGGSGSGSSFSGGSTNGFTGSSSIGGGGTFGGGRSGGMSISGGVSNMNPFASSFANPLAGGLASANGASTSTAFGTPLYSNLITNPTKIVGTNSGSTGGFIGSSGSGSYIGSGNQRGGMSGLGGSGYGANTGSGTYGIFALPYAPAANATYPGTPSRPGTVNPAVIPGGTATPAKLTPLPGRLQTDLQALIGRSDNVSAATRNGLTLGYDAGGTIVLRGTVTSPAEARALESLLRFAPGVSGIRNEMTLKSQ